MDREKIYPDEIAAVAGAVLDGPGETSVDLRQALEARAARLGGAVRNELPLPEDLQAYADLVALDAWQVQDDDIEALKAAGYTEDMIFEITVSLALGAGLARLERGLETLRISQNAAKGAALTPLGAGGRQ